MIRTNYRLMQVKSIAEEHSPILFTFIKLPFVIMHRLHLPYDEYTMPVRCPNHPVSAGSHLPFVIMHRLHLPYDEYTMPVRCPNHPVSAGSHCDHRMDLLASWPQRFYLTPHNDKFEKIVSP